MSDVLNIFKHIKSKEVKFEGEQNYSMKVDNDKLAVKKDDVSLLDVSPNGVTMDLSYSSMSKLIWFFEGIEVRNYLANNAPFGLALTDVFFKGGLVQQRDASVDPGQIAYLSSLLQAPIFTGEYNPENDGQDRGELLFQPTNAGLLAAIAEVGFDMSSADENSDPSTIVGLMGSQMAANPALAGSLQLLLGRASLHASYNYSNFTTTYDDLLTMNGQSIPLIPLAQGSFPGLMLSVEVLDNEVYLVGPVDKTKLIKESGKKGKRGCFYLTCDKLLSIPLPP